VASVVLRAPIGDDPSEFVEIEVDRRDFTVALTWRKPPGTDDA
jgi:hypothetical protein